MLGHIVQVCPHTLGPRISWHDHICNFLAIRPTSKGFNVRAEPVIPIETGTRKPDLNGRKRKDGLWMSLLLLTMQI